MALNLSKCCLINNSNCYKYALYVCEAAKGDKVFFIRLCIWKLSNSLKTSMLWKIISDFFYLDEVF